MLAHESYQRAVTVPDNVFYRWAIDLCYGFLLLDIVQNDRSGRTENEAGRPAVEYFVGLHGRFDSFDD